MRSKNMHFLAHTKGRHLKLSATAPFPVSQLRGRKKALLSSRLNKKDKLSSSQTQHLQLRLNLSLLFPSHQRDFCLPNISHHAFPSGSAVKNSPANAGDVDLILGVGKSPGEGHGNPLQYSCLENPMSLWAVVHRVAKRGTKLKRLSSIQQWHHTIKLHFGSCEGQMKLTSELYHRPGIKNKHLINRIMKAQESKRQGVIFEEGGC